MTDYRDLIRQGDLLAQELGEQPNARNVVLKLVDAITELAICPKCKGNGRRWETFIGETRCGDCNGSGYRQ